MVEGEHSPLTRLCPRRGQPVCGFVRTQAGFTDRVCESEARGHHASFATSAPWGERQVTDGLPSAKKATLTLPVAAWNEFVYGGHFLALGDALTLWALGLVAGIPVSWDFLVIVYLCVFAANLYNRKTEAEHDTLGNGVRVKVMAKYDRAFVPITVVSLGIVIFLLLRFANIAVLLFAAVVFGISILYTAVLKPLTKYVVGFKSYVAAFFYALMVPLMATYYGQRIGWAVLLVFAFYLIRIFISNAACDIKDTESDGKRGLKTLAVYYGNEKAARVLRIVSLLSAIPIAVGIYLGALPLFAAAILLTIAYAYYYLMPNHAADNETLTALIIDGEFLLWLPLVLIGRAFL